jgi:predicted Zn finger-like uncharacterized protein
MAQGYCPACDTKIALGRDPQKGQEVRCPKCGTTFQVLRVSPIELDWVFDEGSIEHEKDREFRSPPLPKGDMGLKRRFSA